MREKKRQTIGTNPALKPCWLMRNWVSALADGSLAGFARWYTKLHVSGCPKCREVLEALRRLRERLRAAAPRPSRSSPTLSDKRWAAIKSALDEVDSRLA